MLMMGKPVNAVSVTPADRRAERTHLFLVATLMFDSSSAPVRVRNLSPSGALIEGQALPPAGAAIVLRRGELDIAGSVVWAAAGRAGLSFGTPVEVSAWLPTKEVSRPLAVDATATGIKQGARGGRAAQAMKVAGPAALSVSAALADLVRLHAELNDLGEELAHDPQVVAAHPEIQWFDPATQRIAKIIEALRASL